MVVDSMIFTGVYLLLFCSFFSVLFGLAGWCDGIDTRGDVILHTVSGCVLGFLTGILVATLFPIMIISMVVQKIIGVWR